MKKLNFLVLFLLLSISSCVSPYDKGTEFMKSKMYDEAIYEFSKTAHYNDPNRVGEYSRKKRGYCYVILGRYNEAIPDFSRDLDPRRGKNFFSCFYRGVALLHLNKSNVALEDFNHIYTFVRKVSSNPTAWFNPDTMSFNFNSIYLFQGLCLTKLGRYEEAYQFLSKYTEKGAKPADRFFYCKLWESIKSNPAANSIDLKILARLKEVKREFCKETTSIVDAPELLW
ncbi:MAG: tetratricopeptide repeat protein [Okeania sp. SIO3C4]|nr:tetratricopeptide repeat protein [Okeania sp. SIO3C4]